MLLLADVKLLEEFLRFFKLCPVDPYAERILLFWVFRTRMLDSELLLDILTSLLLFMLLLADVKLLVEFLRFFKLCPVDPYDERILLFWIFRTRMDSELLLVLLTSLLGRRSWCLDTRIFSDFLPSFWPARRWCSSFGRTSSWCLDIIIFCGFPWSADRDALDTTGPPYVDDFSCNTMPPANLSTIVLFSSMLPSGMIGLNIMTLLSWLWGLVAKENTLHTNGMTQLMRHQEEQHTIYTVDVTTSFSY